MTLTRTVTIYGYADAACGPFPCDEHRTCGLDACHPDGTFQEACAALEKALETEYGGQVRLQVQLLDEGIPEVLRTLIEEHHPPVPIVLIDGRLVPLGRVSLTHIKKFLTA